MANRILLIRALVASAKNKAPDGRKLTEFIGDIRDAIFADSIQDGKILVSSAEAGGSVTFAIPPGHTPLELMELCQEALDWCNQFSDPNNPPETQRRIKRLRADFSRAVIS
jgi:hypothetical protein